jgi:hypothetical protein
VDEVHDASVADRKPADDRQEVRIGYINAAEHQTLRGREPDIAALRHATDVHRSATPSA